MFVKYLEKKIIFKFCNFIKNILKEQLNNRNSFKLFMFKNNQIFKFFHSLGSNFLLQVKVLLVILSD